MSLTVGITAATLGYPEGGGHQWVFLNWALGLKAAGCRVIWLEQVEDETGTVELRRQVAILKSRLDYFGLTDGLTLFTSCGTSPHGEAVEGCLELDAAAAEADLLLNPINNLGESVVARFRRTALLDIDPGELQFWMSKGELPIPHHDIYFTIGETVGQPGSRIPDVGLEWHYVPPCVALDWWPPRHSSADAPITTVAHWYGDFLEGEEGAYLSGKQAAMMPYLELPSRVKAPLELATDLWVGDPDQILLWQHGWRVRDAAHVASSPLDYQRYIQDSRAEFSVVKEHCIRLANAWVSDRSLCYLASGKPVIVEHTGPSRFLPDAEGMFRFRNLDEAVSCVGSVTADYQRQCRAARALAEKYFDARKVAGRLLAAALD